MLDEKPSGLSYAFLFCSPKNNDCCYLLFTLKYIFYRTYFARLSCTFAHWFSLLAVWRIQVVSQCWPSSLFGFLLTCLQLSCPLSHKVHTIYIKCYVSAWPIYIYIYICTHTQIQYIGQYSTISCVLLVFWPTSLITQAFSSMAHTKGNKKYSVL